MRTSLFVVLICACMVTLRLLSSAQSDPQSHGIMGDAEVFAEKHIEALDEQLKLTSDQKNKLRPIFVNELVKVQVILSSSLSAEESQREIDQIHAEAHDRVTTVLTPEQRKRFKDIEPEALPEPRPGTIRI